ncbi:MAG: hypothetical protein AAGG65_13000 [Pseudomonadota bacterium]
MIAAITPAPIAEQTAGPTAYRLLIDGAWTDAASGCEWLKAHDGREVIARMRSDAVVSVGQRMPFAFNMDKAVFFDPQSEQRLS